MPSQAQELVLQLGGGRSLPADETLIMGILNVTPDSFSDGGRYLETDEALTRAIAMSAEGAALIDVGGESTRPGASAVSGGGELARVLPGVRALADRGFPGSVGTHKPGVVLAAGGGGGWEVQ